MVKKQSIDVRGGKALRKGLTLKTIAGVIEIKDGYFFYNPGGFITRIVSMKLDSDAAAFEVLKRLKEEIKTKGALIHKPPAVKGLLSRRLYLDGELIACTAPCRNPLDAINWVVEFQNALTYIEL